MKKLFFTLFAFAVLAVGAKAQEVNEWTAETAENTIAADADIIGIDSIVADTMVADPDPEWYVAPIPYDSIVARHKAIRRAAAADCRQDSVCIFDVDSVLTEVTVYERGDTARTIVWTVNPDGSRIGKSKEESYASPSVVFNASYDWDEITNNWKGIEKTEYVYLNGLMMSNTTLDWVNGDWMPKTRYDYAYDASSREIEYIYYVRNDVNELVPNKSRIQAWSDVSKKRLLEILYTAHDGTAWSAGTKREYNYDAAGNQTEYTYIIYSNGAWVNSSHEIWAFDSDNQKTYYKKETWSADAWKVSNEEYTAYDEDGNIKSLERYGLKNGVLSGTFKAEYTYNTLADVQTSTISYKWSAGNWVLSAWDINYCDDAGNPTETCRYNWKDSKWVGTGKREVNTYDNSKLVEQLTQTWPSNATEWVNSTRSVITYSGAVKTRVASYNWKDSKWVGLSRTDYHYTGSKNDTVWTYTFDTDWVYSERVVNTFNAKGTNIMVHNAAWNGSAWVMTSMTRTDLEYDASNRQILNATWSCAADSVWVGEQKDTTVYSTAGKQIYAATFKWGTNDWIPSKKTETDYDDANRQTDKRIYSWNKTTNDWQGSSRTETVYDGSGNKIVEATYNGWIAATNSWKGNKKTEKKYENKLVMSMVLSNWNTASNDWIPATRYTYAYDDKKREILQSVENYTSGAWVFSIKYEKEYKGNTQLKNNTYQWLNSQWAFNARNEIYYDEDAQAKLRREIVGRWNKSGVVTSFTDKLYFYDCDYSYFTIRFENYDGSLLESAVVESGETPTYSGEKPTKDKTAEYTYTFTGWSPEISAATAAATYTAQFDSVVNTYVIAFENYDGTSLQSGEVAYGTTPKYTGDTPAKPSNAQYTYSFKGWDAELVAVTAAATYTAQFDSVVNTYVIAFENYDGTSLQSGEVAYGTTPKYTGDTPNKLSTPEYTYTFTGWSPEVVAVTEAATYTAQYDSTKNSYLITWLYDDGSEISHATLEYGATPTPADATKPATAQYSFVFKGWNTEVVPVTGEATYTAVYDSIVNQYTVVFYFEDGVTEIERVVLAYGETPSTSYVPSIPGDKQYTYVFVGWSPEVVPVTGDASYTAVFKAVPRQYTIVFKNYNGAELLRTQVDYGTIPVYTGDTPAKKADTRYTYQFDGWTPELTEVTGDATYTAVFKSVLQQYTIVFRNYDGTELQTSLVDYGTMPVYTGETPVKEEDEQYTYSFSGWTPALKQVSGDATYTAKYTSKPKSHEGLNDVEAASQATKVMIDGRIYILRAGHLYTLSGSLVE